MIVDAMFLRGARTDGLERLARSLGASLPPAGSGYRPTLERRVLEALAYDARRAAAEERRLEAKAAMKRTAAEIAAALGETGPRAIAQIERIALATSADWAAEACENAASIYANSDFANTAAERGLVFRDDGTPRTFGGVFFRWCRRLANDRVKDGTLTRREYFRCFYDFAPKPRIPKPKQTPRAREKTPLTRRVNAAHAVRRMREKPQAEVYLIRKAST